MEPNPLEGIKFAYSAENPPPLNVLENKLFAVHATNILPKNGVMIPGGAVGGKVVNDPNAAEFRPTIHFSLGAVVPNHSDIKRENYSYAVVEPLKSLKKQIINVSPLDTFVLGNFSLTEDGILLVPRGADTSQIPAHVKVREYDPQLGLRAAVDNVIKEKEGWHVKMEEDAIGVDAQASIDKVEINSPEFFSSLFEKITDLSFGTHIQSERGEAFRFGFLDLTINALVREYTKKKEYETNSSVNMYSYSELKFRRSLIHHNIGKIKDFIKTKNISPETTEMIENKLRAVNDWMNVIDIDIALKSAGRSLTKSDVKIVEEFIKNRHKPEDLTSLLIDRFGEIAKLEEPDNDRLDIGLGEELSSLPVEEFNHIVSETISNSNSIKNIRFGYALRRAVLIKWEASLKEGLDRMITENINVELPVGLDRPEHIVRVLTNSPLFNVLGDFLRKDSNRLSTALNILNMPIIKSYLSTRYSFYFDGDLRDVSDVVKGFPFTSVLNGDPYASYKDDPAFKVLKELDIPGNFSERIAESSGDFLKQMDLSYYINQEVNWDKLLFSDLSSPLYEVKEKTAHAGKMNFYDLLQREFKTIESVWSKLGLEEEYKKHFSNEDEFWSSKRSFLDIYSKLAAEKKIKEEAIKT